MASETFDLRRPQDYLFNNALVEFDNGNLQLKLIDDFSRSIVQTIVPTAPSGINLGYIADGDPSTYYFDNTAGPNSVITWDLTEDFNLSRVQFTLTQDPRMWDLVVVESTDQPTFVPATTSILYSSGDPTVLSTYFTAYPAGSNIPTDPNVAITSVAKALRQKVRANKIRITLRAGASSPDQFRYLTDFQLFAAYYNDSNPAVISTKIIETIDLTLLTSTEVVPSGTAFGYTFLVDGQEWWFDGFNWARANGTYEQSSPAASLIASLTKLLPTRDRSRVQIKIYLHTMSPSDTPSLSALTLQYDSSNPLVNVPLTRLTGIVRDAFGDPVVGATVTASFIPVGSNTYTINGVRVAVPAPRQVLTSTSGHFSVSVIPTDVMVPSSGNIADVAQWQITIGSPVNDIRKGVVNSVEEIDIYNPPWGM